MVVKSRIGLVSANFRVVVVQSEIGHVAQHVPFAVLRHGLADVQADSPIRDRRLTQRVALHRQASDQVEASAVKHLAAEAGQLRDRPGSAKSSMPMSRMSRPEGSSVCHGGIELGDLVRRHLVDPVVSLGHRWARPGLGVVEKRKVACCPHGVVPCCSCQACGKQPHSASAPESLNAERHFAISPSTNFAVLPGVESLTGLMPYPASRS